MIAVIDYKAGNLTSVVKALQLPWRARHTSRSRPTMCAALTRSSSPASATSAPRSCCMTCTDEATREAIARGVPFLGICVGLQWLYEGSTEAAEHRRPVPLHRPVRALPRDLRRRRTQEPARRLELARRHPPGLEAAARHRARQLRLLHPLLARARRRRHRRHHQLRRRLHRRRRTRQRHGRAVSPGEIRRHRPAVA